jgi:hypothetical protein
MSRRITTQLNIEDENLAVEALNLAGYNFTKQGSSLFITDGILRNAVVNLVSGEIEGDSDYGHTEENFSVLRQYYAEAQIRAECLKNGTTIDERATDSEGNIILMAHMA